jgi:Cu(I)/Ag(I) efflux system protein CusF
MLKTLTDMGTGNVTLDHDAIPSVGWPAMTMAFSAKPDLLRTLSVGHHVNFGVIVTNRSGTLTKITKNCRARH